MRGVYRRWSVHGTGCLCLAKPKGWRKPTTGGTLGLLLLPVLLAAQDYTLEPWINPVDVYAGYTLTMRINVHFTGGKADHVYFTSLSASGSGIDVKPDCGWANPDCWKIGGKPGLWNSNPATSFDVKVTPARGTAPGPYAVDLATASLGIAHKVRLPIRVLAVPATPRRAGLPQKAPPLPGFKSWHSEMTDTGDQFCDPKAKYGFGNERDVWYYDGAYVYFQVYDYTKKPKWKACAMNVANQYRDYVQGGGTPGWRVFTQGLRRAYEETGDASYKNAVAALIDRSAFAPRNGDADDLAIRETAYLLRGFTDAHLMGVAVGAARAQTAANYLIGMADTLFAGPPESTNAMIHEAFFDGILAEALIYYYDNWVKDPRIPPTIRKLCGWIYEYLWDRKSKAMMYSPFPPNQGYPRHCESGCREEERTLINLVVPAYFWYWSLTGDDAVRRQGDEMFAHSLDDPINDKGKSYSQNYHWSFAGVRWRTGK